MISPRDRALVAIARMGAEQRVSMIDAASRSSVVMLVRGREMHTFIPPRMRDNVALLISINGSKAEEFSVSELRELFG